MAASPAKWPVVVGEGRCQFINLWQEVLTTNPDFETIAVANHPGVSPTGLRIAVAMLQGKQLDTTKLGGANGLSFVLPLAMVVTKDNFQEAVDICKDKPDAYLLDDILTEQEVLTTYFK
jgi:ribose transport system substrate-binding protein